MSPSQITIDQEARALLEQENQARFEAAKQAVAERRERQREAAERAAHIAALKTRLSALQDTTGLEKKLATAESSAYAAVAEMDARNAQLAAIRDELQAVGSNLPPDIDLGSHENSYGVTIGDVVVRRQRLQTVMSRMIFRVLRAHITRGEISLDTPRD